VYHGRHVLRCAVHRPQRRPRGWCAATSTSSRLSCVSSPATSTRRPQSWCGCWAGWTPSGGWQGRASARWGIGRRSIWASTCAPRPSKARWAASSRRCRPSPRRRGLGSLGWSKLRLLAQVAQPATEPKWLDLAREMSVGPLARVVSAYRRASDADDPDRFENQRQRRGIWLFDEPDGLVRVTGLLEPDDAAMLRAALAAQGEGCGATTARTPTSPINPASATRPTPTLTPAAPATPTSPARTANPMSWPATLLWGSRRGPRKWTRRWRRGIGRRPSGSMRGWRWRGRAGRRRGARRRRAQRLVNRAQRRALRFRDGPGCAFLGCVLSKPTELPPGRRLRPVGRENRGATARAGRVRRHRRRGWRVRDPIQCTEAHWGHSLTPVDGPPRLVPRVTGRAPPPGPRRA
jgi:Domain of unknown function (DUF222)